LFAHGDVQDLAAKIQLLEGDRGLGRRLGESARAHALKVFAIREHVNQVEGVYRQILSTPPA
ncbi:MAG: hypothetical protein K2Y02_07315, partial [Burkholderiaceae bacterium]|nr:hypothetical protein [Burkholderiaceae bacterium]